MPAISGWKKLIGICMKDKITLSWISRNRIKLQEKENHINAEENPL